MLSGFLRKSAVFIIGMTLYAQSGYAFKVESKDFKEGGNIGNDFFFNNMGCTGKNQSPELHWKDAPKGTQSFAVAVYDQDAPTGSGFWHWTVLDIPVKTTALPRGWKPANAAAGVEVVSDFGAPVYNGPCPPKGMTNRYNFIVYAVKVPKLEFPAGATNAFIRFILESQTIAKAKLVAKGKQ